MKSQKVLVKPGNSGAFAPSVLVIENVTRHNVRVPSVSTTIFQKHFKSNVQRVHQNSRLPYFTHEEVDYIRGQRNVYNTDGFSVFGICLVHRRNLGGRREGGQVPVQYILYLTIFFFGYWFEVEIHAVNLAPPPS